MLVLDFCHRLGHGKLLGLVIRGGKPNPTRMDPKKDEEMTAKRMALTLSLFLAGAVLVGCGSKAIVLPSEQVSVVAGESLQLRVESRSREFEYQWQKNGGDIEGARGDSLNLEKDSLEDVGLYRCKVYSRGETAETNYTSAVALFVSTRSLILSNVQTPVAGPFQPNQPSLISRCYSNGYTSYIRFAWPGPTVWYTPSGATTCTVTDSSQVGAGYSALVEVVESGTLTSFCGTGTPSSVSFKVNPGKKYKFVIFVLNKPPPPSAGQKLSLDIVWK